MCRSNCMRRFAAVSLRVTVILVAGAATLPARAADEHFGIEPVRFINEQITAGWSDAGLQPAAAATDGDAAGGAGVGGKVIRGDISSSNRVGARKRGECPCI